MRKPLLPLRLEHLQVVAGRYRCDERLLRNNRCRDSRIQDGTQNLDRLALPACHLRMSPDLQQIVGTLHRPAVAGRSERCHLQAISDGPLPLHQANESLVGMLVTHAVRLNGTVCAVQCLCCRPLQRTFCLDSEAELLPMMDGSVDIDNADCHFEHTVAEMICCWTR